MGKYGDVKFVRTHLEGSDVRNAILMAIANELAEANRLKRFELNNIRTNQVIASVIGREQNDFMFTNENLKELQKDFEDKA